MQTEHVHSYSNVNAAFTKQAEHYDADDQANPILQSWRHRVYGHVTRYLLPDSFILELNAGTGIDASYFVKKGHYVHATDISDGMIKQLQFKMEHDNELKGRLSCEQCSYTNLASLKLPDVEYVFSNFGGLNCVDDLSKVTDQLKGLLKPSAYVTFVIMPKITPWEWLWALKGDFKKSFRRMKSKGTLAHLKDEHFLTFYFSLSDIIKAFGKDFQFERCESLGFLSPPPGSTKFYHRFRGISKMLEVFDMFISMMWPFNRWGDHIITTFQYIPSKR